MKITDTLITTLLKHGVFGELKNFKTEIVIPAEKEGDAPKTIVITADALQIRMDNGEGR